jgi:DNA-directed RNA polymerase specialized sigma24 family protein
VADPQDAEDVLQEVLLRIHHNAGERRPDLRMGPQRRR